MNFLSLKYIFILSQIIIFAFVFDGCQKCKESEMITDICELEQDDYLGVDELWRIDINTPIIKYNQNYFITKEPVENNWVITVYDSKSGKKVRTIDNSDIEDIVNYSNIEIIGDKLYLGSHYNEIVILDIITGSISKYEINENPGRVKLLEDSYYVLEYIFGEYILNEYDYESGYIRNLSAFSLKNIPIIDDFEILKYERPDVVGADLLIVLIRQFSTVIFKVIDMDSGETYDFFKETGGSSTYRVRDFELRGNSVFINLKSLQLSYNIPSKQLDKIAGFGELGNVDMCFGPFSSIIIAHGNSMESRNYEKGDTYWKCDNSETNKLILCGDYILDIVDDGLALRNTKTGQIEFNNNYPDGVSNMELYNIGEFKFKIGQDTIITTGDLRHSIYSFKLNL